MPDRPWFNSLPACSLVFSVIAFVVPPFAAGELPEAPVPNPHIVAALGPQTDQPEAAKPQHRSLAAAITERPQPSGHLTLRDRFLLQTRTSFSPVAIVTPAFEAAVTVADPPDNYPREWSDGAGAFGRNYAAELGRHTTSGYTHFAAAAILHEDPRYFHSESRNYLARAMHAFAFTLVDRSDSGHRTLAMSNILGSAGGGFVGMAWEPNGWDDTAHALQRSEVEMTSFAAHNLIEEFAPEFSRIAVKLHLSKAQGALMPDSKAPEPDKVPGQDAPKP